MKLRDQVQEIVIPPDKLVKYALNMNHPKGKHKAHLFQVILGYTVTNYQELQQQIEKLALDGEAVWHHQDEYGQHWQIDMIVNGTQGQTAVIRTGWLIQPGNLKAQLTTLYILESEVT